MTWNGSRGQVRRHPPQSEVEFSTYNFEEADVPCSSWTRSPMYEKECIRLVERGLVFPAYDFVMKCSHTFNLLDARGAISVTERASYIGRVRNVARLCAEAYVRAAGTARLSDAERRDAGVYEQGTVSRNRHRRDPRRVPPQGHGRHGRPHHEGAGAGPDRLRRDQDPRRPRAAWPWW